MILEDGLYPVFSGGAETGEARVQRQGVYTAISCRCPMDGPGVTRLCAFSGERSAPIGVMLPGDGALSIRKKLSRSGLEALGPGKLRYFTLSKDGAAAEDWQDAPSVAALFDDILLSRLAPVRGALTKREEGVSLLAVPWSPDAPFPLMPIFCLGRPFDRDGRDYLLFSVSDGRPVIAPERSPTSSRRDPR